MDIRRKLAESNPDAFLPDLARSLAARGSILRGMARRAEAEDTFHQGLKAALPAVTACPEAFAGLAAPLAGDYAAANAFTGCARDIETLTALRERCGAEARDAADDALASRIPNVLPADQPSAARAREAVKRLRSVCGKEGVAGRALNLLDAAAAYVQADRNERAILHLPVEQRRLILEAYEEGKEEGGTTEGQ